MKDIERLQSEVIVYVTSNRPSRRRLIEVFTKEVGRVKNPPAWTKSLSFSGKTWMELDVAERKHQLRWAVNELLCLGRIKSVPYVTSTGLHKRRLEPTSILEVFAAIVD